MTTNQTPRPLYEIAREIKRLWPEPYFGAVPYIEAMESLSAISDSYGMDGGYDIVLHFLSNAKTWKGDDATRIKNELRVMIGQKPVVSKAKAAKPKAEPVDRAQRKADAMVVKHAVMRTIFCPCTGNVLDMRRAVVVDTGSGILTMAATKWDEIKDDFRASVIRALGEDTLAKVKVYDGRELFTPSGSVRYSR